MRLAILAVLAVLASGCTAGPGRASAALPPAEITCAMRARVDAIGAPRTRHKQTVRLELSAPFMPSSIRARGAVAMDPRAGDLRMILLGPGGGTAVDLWMHEDAYRFVVPAMNRTMRGDAATPVAAKKGLPVDFLGWWMLHPLRGELLFVEERDGALSFVLRDRQRSTIAYVDATLAADGAFEATRTTWAGEQKVDEETLKASGLGCARVEYTQASTELRVVAECEVESADVPDKAFADPDAPPPTAPPSAEPPA